MMSYVLKCEGKKISNQIGLHLMFEKFCRWHLKCNMDFAKLFHTFSQVDLVGAVAAISIGFLIGINLSVGKSCKPTEDPCPSYSNKIEKELNWSFMEGSRILNLDAWAQRQKEHFIHHSNQMNKHRVFYIENLFNLLICY